MSEILVYFVLLFKNFKIHKQHELLDFRSLN